MYKFVLFTCLDECCWVFSVLWYFDLFKDFVDLSIAFHVLSHACSKQKLNGRKKKYQKMTSSLNVRMKPNPHLHVTISDVVMRCRKVNNGVEMLEFNFCVLDS